jgi:hypothetical protein
VGESLRDSLLLFERRACIDIKKYKEFYFMVLLKYTIQWVVCINSASLLKVTYGVMGYGSGYRVFPKDEVGLESLMMK